MVDGRGQAGGLLPAALRELSESTARSAHLLGADELGDVKSMARTELGVTRIEARAIEVAHAAHK